MAGFGKQRLGSLRVVRQHAGIGQISEVVRGDHRPGRSSEGVAPELGNLVAVDGVRHRLPHADIVERLLVRVDMEQGQLGRIEDVDHRTFGALSAGEPLTLRQPGGCVDLARGKRQITRGVGIQETIRHFLDFRCASEIVLVCHEMRRLTRLDFRQREGSRAHRITAEIRAELFDSGLRHDEATRVIGENPEYRWDLLLEGDTHRQRIDRFDLFDGGIVAGKGRALGIGRLGEAVDDIIGRDLAVPLLPLHPRAQLEGPDQLVIGSLPAFRQVRFNFGRIGRARRKAHERAEDPGHKGAVRGAGRKMGVQLAHIGSCSTEGELGLFGMSLQRCERGTEQECGGQSAAADRLGYEHDFLLLCCLTLV